MWSVGPVLERTMVQCWWVGWVSVLISGGWLAQSTAADTLLRPPKRQSESKPMLHAHQEEDANRCAIVNHSTLYDKSCGHPLPDQLYPLLITATPRSGTCSLSLLSPRALSLSLSLSRTHYLAPPTDLIKASISTAPY
jgi:hypothetical protein